MADHFFVDGWIKREGYTSPVSGGSKVRTPSRDRLGHGTNLKNKFEQAWLAARARQSTVAVIAGNPDGLLVQFESDRDFYLDLEKLDLRPQGIQLAAVKQVGGVQLATVFVPEGKVQFFLKRFEDYLTKVNARWGNPVNRSLVESIADIRLATLESLWTEPFVPFPTENRKIWWEIWLRNDNGNELERFRLLAAQMNLKNQPGHLSFLDRSVVLCQASPMELTQSLDLLNDFAELRMAKDVPTFFLRLSGSEQASWVQDLVGRTQSPVSGSPVICVLDTGVNHQHALLSGALDANDLHSYLPQWGTSDHGGHGTEMAGVALYGDLTIPLASTGPVILQHRLESAKILPPIGDNDPRLYGLINSDAASRVEIANPSRKRVFLMAITATDERDRGLPTSWSAAIDDLSAGVDDLESDNRRLFVISAGNRTDVLSRNYFEESLLDSIHDPGQSWNALTVGAYTEKGVITEPEYSGWELLAKPGELCPSSTTSRTWSTQWPLKPDIVMEGGNYASQPDEDQFISSLDSLSLLTTHYKPLEKQFVSTGDTSAAAALAARMVATVQSRYPHAWPETLRAILVHSARWSTQMQAQATIATASAKQNLETLLRCFGHGVPNLQRALDSTSNALTLIAQETIFPYERDKTKEMILHSLPWPKETLADLGSTEVRMRVTLSYFIESNPARRGWTKRHRYSSHGLRFDVKTATETVDQFRSRLNAQAREEEDGALTSSDADQWLLGPKLRSKGSIHTDVWTGTAADLAERGFIGIYPVLGWWRERHQLNRWQRGARYSLVVSIETAATEVDLYVPISTIIQMGIPIEISIEI